VTEASGGHRNASLVANDEAGVCYDVDVIMEQREGGNPLKCAHVMVTVCESIPEICLLASMISIQRQEGFQIDKI
jgi:Flp pilus assembly protein TadB